MISRYFHPMPRRTKRSPLRISIRYLPPNSKNRSLPSLSNLARADHSSGEHVRAAPRCEYAGPISAGKRRFISDDVGFHCRGLSSLRCRGAVSTRKRSSLRAVLLPRTLAAVFDRNSCRFERLRVELTPQQPARRAPAPADLPRRAPQRASRPAKAHARSVQPTP